jgi:hypothetical protein
MTMARFAHSIALLLATLGPAFAWEVPAPGSADRKGLMDAIRPHAEEALGAPVEFVIEDVRISDDVAFVMVWPQRPGGGKIDLYTTPLALTDDYFPHFYEGSRIDALLERSENIWIVKKLVIGVMAKWWSDPAYCAAYAAVIPESCRYDTDTRNGVGSP